MSDNSENERTDVAAPTADTALVRVAPAAPLDVVSAQALKHATDQVRGRKRRRSLRTWSIRGGALLIAVVVGSAIWRGAPPPTVTLVHPTLTTITETIASSGRVGGATETLVGAQAQGVVQQLDVKEGDRVIAGQRLALLKNDVAVAQVAQAEQTVNTARSQVTQAARGPLSSEVEAATGQVRQAEAQTTQQRAAVTQAERSVAQARALLNQLTAERDQASQESTRSRALFEQGLVARADYEKTQTMVRVAQERVAAQRQAIAFAEANVAQARAGLEASQANLRVQQAHLQTVQSGAHPEDVQVARQRLREAEQTLRVVREQAQNAVVTAPFAGVVTAINAELGQTVGVQGVLTLVSNDPEIRLDVDESNLADVKVGQHAFISSTAFPNSTFDAEVTEIAAAVDVARGTVRLTVTPASPPDWLRPGQTVNVNIVTAKDAQRLLIPPTALTRVGDDTVVLVVENDVALQKVVVTRPPTTEGVPVIAGLREDDLVIVDVGGITAGDRVRAKANNAEGQP
jgi:RND family efflux transporter MFP subunit